MPGSSVGLRAIPTKYGDVLFRSRLEARWAVFFDALKIKWEYEPEGYELSDGSRYLPDFWLPTFGGGTFVEVKPKGGDYSKARQFAVDIGKPLWMAEGPPGLNITYTVGGSLDEAGVTCDTPVIPLYDQAEYENRFFACPGDVNSDGTFPPSAAPDRYVEAVRLATGYSFWQPGGGTPTRLGVILSQRPWR